METAQKNVLKRKRHPIAIDVNLKKEYIALFRENTDSINHILKVLRTRFNEKVRRKRSQKRTESLQFQKMMKFLELLPQYGGKKGYDTLVSILENNHFWLGEELKAELKAEKDELDIEDYVHDLAEYVINKQFGKSLRLSGVDKRALKYLMAKRIQYAKEVCRGRLQNRKAHLHGLRDVGFELDNEILQLVNKIREFIHLNKPDLAQAYIAKKSAQIAVEIEGDEDKETGESEKSKTDLEFAVEDLIEMMDLSIKKKSDIEKERYDSLLVMKSTNHNVELDSELARILKELEDQIEAKKRQAELEDEKIRKLKAEILGIYAAMEDAKRKREREIIELTEYMTHANEMLRLILDDIEQLRRELMFCKQKADQYKVRFAKLERTRRIGYLDSTAPTRANIMEVARDKQRAKVPIMKPRIIKVQTAQNISSNNNNVKPNF